jgi:hypothetical protein
MDCNYHKIVPTIIHLVSERIDDHYEWDMFSYWLGDESNLGRRYVDTVRNLIPTINEEQVTYLEKMGSNLETQIGKWRSQQHNTKNCVLVKMREYIYYQFKRPRARAIVGHPC